MLADVLRDASAEAPAPVPPPPPPRPAGAPDAIPAPASPPAGPVTPGGGLAALAQSLYADPMMAAQQQANEARARAAEALERKQAEMAPRIEATQAQGQQVGDEAMRRQGALEASRPSLAPPPSLGLSPFLSPRDGEAPESLIGKMIQALGLFAAGIGGMAAGDARGSLAALTGALKGWQTGDRERADRAFAEWQARTQAALKAWEMERSSYEDWFKAANVSMDQMQRGLTLEALKHDNAVAADIFKAGDFDAQVKFFQERDQSARQLLEITGKLAIARVDAAIKGLPTGVVAALRADPEADAALLRGERPTPEMIGKAMLLVQKQNIEQRAAEGREAALLKLGIEPQMLLSPDEAARLKVAYGTTKAEAFGQRPVTPAQETSQQAVQGSLAIVDRLTTLLKDIELPTDLGGRVKAAGSLRLLAASQTNQSLNLFDSMKEGVLAQIARAFGERGTMTDADMARARALLPVVVPKTPWELPDTGETAKGKLEQLRALIQEIDARGRGVASPTGPGAVMVPGAPAPAPAEKPATQPDYEWNGTKLVPTRRR